MNIVILEKKRMQWSLDTFTEATPQSSLEKAKEEIKEIESDLKKDIKNPYEYADAIMCIFDAAGRMGISAAEVMAAYAVKININIERDWTKNKNNSYSHKKECHNNTCNYYPGRFDRYGCVHCRYWI